VEHNKWENLTGPGDSRVTAQQVVEDEGLVGAAWGSDKVVLVTGFSSGIGAETVRVLASTGATVFGTARNLDKARRPSERRSSTRAGYTYYLWTRQT
jgi:3-oxoacyl-ACP reductase-like protein